VLAKWVADLANQPVANHPASIAKPPTFLLQTRPNALAELMDAYATAENSPAAVQAAKEQPVSPGEEIPTGEYQPRDPFDPEIFNRRFHRDAGGSK